MIFPRTTNDTKEKQSQSIPLATMQELVLLTAAVNQNRSRIEGTPDGNILTLELTLERLKPGYRYYKEGPEWDAFFKVSPVVVRLPVRYNRHTVDPDAIPFDSQPPPQNALIESKTTALSGFGDFTRDQKCIQHALSCFGIHFHTLRWTTDRKNYLRLFLLSTWPRNQRLLLTHCYHEQSSPIEFNAIWKAGCILKARLRPGPLHCMATLLLCRRSGHLDEERIHVKRQRTSRDPTAFGWLLYCLSRDTVHKEIGDLLRSWHKIQLSEETE